MCVGCEACVVYGGVRCLCLLEAWAVCGARSAVLGGRARSLLVPFLCGVWCVVWFSQCKAGRARAHCVRIAFLRSKCCDDVLLSLADL